MAKQKDAQTLADARERLRKELIVWLDDESRIDRLVEALVELIDARVVAVTVEAKMRGWWRT